MTFRRAQVSGAFIFLLGVGTGLCAFVALGMTMGTMLPMMVSFFILILASLCIGLGLRDLFGSIKITEIGLATYFGPIELRDIKWSEIDRWQVKEHSDTDIGGWRLRLHFKHEKAFDLIDAEYSRKAFGRILEFLMKNCAERVIALDRQLLMEAGLPSKLNVVIDKE